jgi:CubicO group peptidase (beta-lactamase class C family)
VALDSATRAGRFGHIDHLLVIRNGHKVVEHNYPRDYRTIAAGKSSPIGCGPGACAGRNINPDFNYFDPATHPYRNGTGPHNLQSTSKSVIATVLGAAQHQGAIRSLDAPMLSYLTTWRDVRTDPRLAKATLRDLLTMRSGIEWHEQDRPLDSTNTTLQLERSADWVRFTLSQPMDAEPGTKWAYNSGGSHLISAVIREATGMNADEYARRHLFGPMGITDFFWKQGGGGLPDGESGVYLHPGDLAKLGYLMLHDGVWDGRRLLPAGWAREATTRHVDQGPANGWGYGYQWWRLDRNGLEIWGTLGFGGQFMLIVPSEQLIVVSLGWNVYGDQVPGILGPLLNAVAASIAPR